MEQKPRIPCKKDVMGYFFLGIGVMMLLKSLMLCFSSDIWYDELFTVGMIEHSYGDLIGFTARDVHPPLYYCIVKLFVDLCKFASVQISPVVVAKIVSVLPYFILFIYGLSLVRKRFGTLTAGLFLFCVMAMPQLSAYMVEVRMYGWALLFVTAAFLHGYELTVAGGGRRSGGCGLQTADSVGAPDVCGLRTTDRAGVEDAGGLGRARRMHGTAMVLYGLAAAYTQYFACVAAAMVYFYVLLMFFIKDRGRIKEWLLYAGLTAIGYGPWLLALFGQITAVRENYWILPLTWRSLGGCVKFLTKPAFTDAVFSTVLAVILFVAYATALLHAIIKLYHYGRENTKNGHNYDIDKSCFILAGVGVLAGVVLFGFAASFLMRPVFVYRYMVPAMGCFWLSFAVALEEMARDGKRLIRKISIGIMLLVLVVGLRDYRAFRGEEEYKILLMEETRKALTSIAPQDIVLYNFDQVQAVTSYYLDSQTESYLWRGTPETLIQDIVRPYGTLEETGQIKAWCRDGRKVWFIGSFNSREDIVAEWKADGLQVDETGSYLLERYWFNLYKISLERP